nr:Arm DNA-binding domain-containing protein [Desulfovibrio sp.]
MARKQPLTADQIKAYKPNLSETHPRDRLGCGNGLYLLFTLAGARSWLHRVRIPGGDSWITLGEYGDAVDGKVNLTEARKRQGEAVRRLEAGVAPSQIKFGMAAVRLAAAEKAAKEDAGLTFGEAACAWLDADAPNVVPAVRRRRETWFTGYLQGPLGSRPIASIAQDELVAAAETPLSKSISGREVRTVHRSLAQMIGQIYDYARMTHRELQNCWTDV